MRAKATLLCAVFLASCAKAPPPEVKLTVAAAANLTDVLGEVGTAFTKKSGITIVYSFGSTAQLAQQIENGAPFDVFAAADVEHVNSLVKEGKVDAASRAVYARGQLALWIPKGDATGIRELKDLASPKIRFIAIAQPKLAPYGLAAEEALKASKLWDTVHGKIVYANNISLAKQLAASGNADASFTAYSLVLHESGIVLQVDPKLYSPIEQALGVVTSSTHTAEARQFNSFLLGSEGRAILAKGGYQLP